MDANNENNRLIIEATNNLPYVDFNNNTGIVIIKGRSYSENAYTFYSRLNKWANDYLLSKPKSTHITLAFQYLNTSSGVQVFNFIRNMQQSKSYGDLLTVEWGYEEDDDDLLQLGQDFSTALQLPFEFKVVEFD